MGVTKAQLNLFNAVRNKQVNLVREMLEQDGVNPNFDERFNDSPLHEAVRQNSLTMVRLLVDNGADVGRCIDTWVTPLGLAEREDAVQAIIDFLTKAESNTRSWRYNEDSYWTMPQEAPPRKKAPAKPRKPKTPPRFTAKTLPEIFRPEKWVGQVDKMQQEWELVPKKLKKAFDIAAAVSEARQQTLKSKMPSGGIVLKKTP